VALRKPHACGGRAWQILRIGADVGLKCATCGRRIEMSRDEFERRAVASAAANDLGAPGNGVTNAATQNG
jgi:hypothetical protein